MGDCENPKILTESKAKAILKAINFKENVLDNLDSFDVALLREE